MATPLVLDTLLDLAGPFLFPVVAFALGVVGYGVLLVLGRLGVVGDERTDHGSSGGEGTSDDGARTDEWRRL